MSFQSHRLRRRLLGEPLEQRWLLSADAFIPRDIDPDEDISYGSFDVADVDGDGDTDLVFIGSQGVFWHDSADGLEHGIVEPCECPVNSITAADVDGDGDLDALIAWGYPWRNDGVISWYENTDGRGAFAPAGSDVGGHRGAPAVVGAEDIDGDEDIDLVVTWQLLGGQSELRWYENVGGTFEHRQLIFARASSSVDLADVDGDGDVDVLTTTESTRSSQATWYENQNGQGDFGEPRQIVTVASGSLLFADVDRDGDIDILSQTAWFANMDGKFEEQEQREMPLGDRLLLAADLDHDGDIDVISESGLGEHLVWFENADGGGTFDQHHLIDPHEPFNTRQLKIADVDGDGDDDIVALNFLIWYEHRHVGDVNDDGVFDSSDLVRVFTAGEYEDDVPDNSTFDEGDWDRDGDFGSGDLVLAFQAGNYVRVAAPTISEVAAAVDWLFAERNTPSSAIQPRRAQ